MTMIWWTPCWSELIRSLVWGSPTFCPTPAPSRGRASAQGPVSSHRMVSLTLTIRQSGPNYLIKNSKYESFVAVDLGLRSWKVRVQFLRDRSKWDKARLPLWSRQGLIIVRWTSSRLGWLLGDRCRRACDGWRRSAKLQLAVQLQIIAPQEWTIARWCLIQTSCQTHLNNNSTLPIS